MVIEILFPVVASILVVANDLIVDDIPSLTELLKARVSLLFIPSFP